MSVLKDRVNKLLLELRKGNEYAFEELYDATYNHLRIVARNYLYDKANIDEVLNVAYFKIYRYASSSRPNRDGYNWMCKIVQNTAYDINKQQQIIIPINEIQNNRLFEGLYSEALDRSDLYTIIHTFSKLDQEVLYLKFWEDLSYFEIAKKIGMKKSTVHKRIKKLLKIIEEKISIE